MKIKSNLLYRHEPRSLSLGEKHRLGGRGGGAFRKRRGGEYMDIRRSKNQEAVEMFITRSFKMRSFSHNFIRKGKPRRLNMWVILQTWQ
jgi:hypothetical protein